MGSNGGGGGNRGGRLVGGAGRVGLPANPTSEQTALAQGVTAARVPSRFTVSVEDHQNRAGSTNLSARARGVTVGGDFYDRYDRQLQADQTALRTSLGRQFRTVEIRGIEQGRAGGRGFSYNVHVAR